MSNKRLYIVLGIMFISLTMNGCQSNNGSGIVPAFSDSVMEIEITEPADSLNRGNESSENKIDADGSAIGTDGKTNEELEQELNAIEDVKPDPSTSTDGIFDGGGVNLETGEYDPYHDTNNGQGWDKLGQHFDTWGEYKEAFYEASMSDPDNLTQEELETLGNGGTVTFD